MRISSIPQNGAQPGTSAVPTDGAAKNSAVSGPGGSASANPGAAGNPPVASAPTDPRGAQGTRATQGAPSAQSLQNTQAASTPKATGPAPAAGATPGVNQTAALAAARQDAAARPGGMAPMMADLARVAASATQTGSSASATAGIPAATFAQLPTTTQTAITRILGLGLSTDTTPTGSDISRAFTQSGLFTEANIAAASQTAATGGTGIIPVDMKMLILILRASLRAAGSNTSTPNNTDETDAAAGSTTGKNNATARGPANAGSRASAGARDSAGSPASPQTGVRGTPPQTSETQNAPRPAQGQSAASAAQTSATFSAAGSSGNTASAGNAGNITGNTTPVQPVAPATTQNPQSGQNTQAGTQLPAQQAMPASDPAEARPPQSATGATSASNTAAALLARAGYGMLAQSEGRDTDPDVLMERALMGGAPLPQAGGPTQGQAAQSSLLPTDADLDTIVRYLLFSSDTALSHQKLLQFASLQGSDGAQKTTSPHWMFEIPVATPNGTTMVQFAIDKDGGGENADGSRRTPHWQVRFSIDIAPLGPVHVSLALNEKKTWVTMWSPRPDTLAMLRGGAEELTDALTEAELPAEITFGPVKTPQAKRRTGPGHFLDNST